MIAGFTGNNGPEQGLEEDSVDVWSYSGPTDNTRGLVFGLQDVLLDQHVFQRGRIARLINASFGAGELGIGVDANTAATIEGGTNLTEIGGDTGAFVADSLTYHAAAHFDTSGTLSIHDVATQVLPAGDGYDMAARQPIVSGSSVLTPDIAGRAFPTLATPVGSGPLLLAGGSPSAAILDRLVNDSGGAGSKIVVIAAGYAKPEDATKDAKAFAASLAAGGASATWFVLNSKTKTADVTAALSAAQGVLLTAPDPATVLSSLDAAPTVEAGIRSAWIAERPSWATTPPPPPSAPSSPQTPDRATRPPRSRRLESMSFSPMASLLSPDGDGSTWASNPGSSRTAIGAACTAL